MDYILNSLIDLEEEKDYDLDDIYFLFLLIFFI